MRASKALAYELTKIVPLEVIKTYQDNPDHPNDLQKVGGALIESHLPGWLYYAIRESDHTVTNLDTKIPAYIDEETIIETARDYAEQENPVINLNKPGSRDWMQEDPMSPYRDQFEEEYDAFISAFSSVLSRVYGDEFEEFTDDDYVTSLATEIVDELDVFTLELYRQNTPDSKTEPETIVAEWIINELSLRELAENYLWHYTDLDDYSDDEDYFESERSLRETLEDCRANANLSEYSGFISGMGYLPDEESHRDEFIDKSGFPDVLK